MQPAKIHKGLKKGTPPIVAKMHGGSDLRKVAANGFQCLLCRALMDPAEPWGWGWRSINWPMF